jgi:hypothetical protein
MSFLYICIGVPIVPSLEVSMPSLYKLPRLALVPVTPQDTVALATMDSVDAREPREKGKPVTRAQGLHSSLEADAQTTETEYFDHGQDT